VFDLNNVIEENDEKGVCVFLKFSCCRLLIVEIAFLIKRGSKQGKTVLAGGKFFPQ